MARLKSNRLPSFAATLLIGLILGWLVANQRPTPLRAMMGTGADRSGDYAAISVPVGLEYNDQNKIQAPKDAIFFVDYRAARLLATIPILQQSTTGTQIIDGFVERDLAKDFKLAENSADPHFVLTAGSFGAGGATWSPLFVFETVSRQVAIYRVQPQQKAGRSLPKFDLLEVRSFAPDQPLPELPASARRL